jgi:hypothetical protein
MEMMMMMDLLMLVFAGVFSLACFGLLELCHRLMEK